ncbi:DUF2103 domain-containing protein [Leptolyngbya sp. FACHB-261]|uniref:DUF2103 domain-containing protein n=1 Tax=Leptolyngbya sp. FACHB-261 TaxID=2692806 RepID=UPI0016879B1D|nr:DUF2103 domain-containing protein [Leptolyngbya sp. FACHB-261]MBD2102302.1 metal-binding protein [Leptolyngbya sp. FACHB-261]
MSGRVVLNHSTHVPGLIPILHELARRDGIQTITPGVLSSARAQAPRLILRISTPIRGGFKLQARKGKTVQEVFVITRLSQVDLESAVAQVLDR